MQHSNQFHRIAVTNYCGQLGGLADTVMLTPAGRASRPIQLKHKLQSLYVQLTSEITSPRVA